MKRRCTLLLLCTLLLSFSSKITAQTFQVQIAAFTENIDHTFFDFLGYSDVSQSIDHNNFIRYSIGEFYSAGKAERVRIDAIARGFENTKIIRLDQPNYAYLGDAHQIPFLMVPKEESLYIRSVPFSVDDLSINKDLLASLEETLLIMSNHTELKLRIVGHTDDIGEKEVNQAISKKRARTIRNFLLANGIPAYRLNIKVSEKPSPEVYFKGKGLPKNRDYNRRIIMTLVDLKDEIVADNFQEDLKNGTYLSSIEKVTELMKFVKFV